jgi:hypothetical protein
MQTINPTISGPGVNESIESRSPDACQRSEKSPHVATAAEGMKNYRENTAATWYEDDAGENDHTGKYAFQRLRQTWFTPHIIPKFKLHGDISSMRLAPVLRGALNVVFKTTASRLKARRRNLPNFSQRTESLQDWDLRTNTTRTRS